VATALVQHRVRDYDAWRRVYDNAKDMQAAGGVLDEAVFRAERDPNNILVMHRFETMQAAHDYFENPQLVEAVRQAGVDEATVRLEFYEDA
jgi:hypothetical protein